MLIHLLLRVYYCLNIMFLTEGDVLVTSPLSSVKCFAGLWIFLIFFLKIKKIRFFLFKSDFFDLKVPGPIS